MKIKPATDISISLSRSEAASIAWVLGRALIKDKKTGHGIIATRFGAELSVAVKRQEVLPHDDQADQVEEPAG